MHAKKIYTNIGEYSNWHREKAYKMICASHSASRQQMVLYTSGTGEQNSESKYSRGLPNQRPTW